MIAESCCSTTIAMEEECIIFQKGRLNVEIECHINKQCLNVRKHGEELTYLWRGDARGATLENVPSRIKSCPRITFVRLNANVPPGYVDVEK